MKETEMSKTDEPVVGVPYYAHQNPYQAGMIPPNAVFGDPKGVPIQQTIYRDTPAPFNCLYCGNSGLTTIKVKSGSYYWLYDANDAWNLLSLPVNGLSMAQISFLPELQREGCRLREIGCLCCDGSSSMDAGKLCSACKYLAYTAFCALLGQNRLQYYWSHGRSRKTSQARSKVKKKVKEKGTDGGVGRKLGLVSPPSIMSFIDGKTGHL
ncbi:hypothetical protein G4B88_006126 [Cannabis sativa]|uniref:Uncharacterized protein n=1 Tax=Cannabis sativa TaxID=3483 RepID=A0A7J6IDG6_CANSA|nr:hypothetical protein G4B88_006126 [Cannabis sativa]